jgi:hypothetical protein
MNSVKKGETMVKNKIEATVVTSSGTKIRISGIKDEVKDILSVFSDKSKTPASTKKRDRERRPGSKTTKSRQSIKPALTELVESGFFKGKEKRIEDVVERLSHKGYNVKGRKVGALATALTFLCRDEDCDLERRPLDRDEKTGKENWAYYSKEK